MSTRDTAYQRITDALRDHGSRVTVNGHRAQAQCPVHDDHSPSLSLTAIDGRVLVYCHAGCQTTDILSALSLAAADLFDNPRGQTYTYPDGRSVYRTPDKQFRQSGNTQGRSLFHVDKIGSAGTIYIVEGEQDVLALESVGAVAVCPAMGAGKAHLFDWRPLRGKHVIIVADRDEPGRKHAKQVANLLKDIAASVSIVEPATGKDSSDHIAAGHQPSDFKPLETADNIDGAQLLDELRATFTRYVAFPDEHSAVAATLWTATTHAIPAFECAPRLVAISPEKRCGKTRLLDIITGTCHQPLATSDATVAAIFRSLGGQHPPTLIIDEADAIWGTKKAAEQHEDLRKLLNAGHQRGKPALRCVGPNQIPTEFATFCMVALAGIGRMPDTITDRAVSIMMRRRASAEKVSQFRSRRDGPALQKLRDRLAGWAAEHIEELCKAQPVLPAQDRAADTWEPLIAVADAAGGHWPQTARAACAALVGRAEGEDEDRSLGTRLLADIQQVFADKSVAFLSSADLVAELRRLEESPWDDFELTTRKLASRLKDFGIKPGRAERNTVRGYALEAFYDAFSRYLRPQASNPSTTHVDQDKRVDSSESEDGSKCPHDLSVHKESAGQTAFEDEWTDVDGCTAQNGAPVAGCPCGRPAPVNRETGLCSWCELKASKQEYAR